MRVIVVGSGVAGDTAAVAAGAQAPEAEIMMVTGESHPLYSACIFGHFLSGHIPRANLFLRTEEDYQRMGIERVLGVPVVAGDGQRRTIILETAELAYDRLVLATGSEAIVPRIAGCSQAGVFAMKSMSDLDGLAGYLPRSGTARIGIVGSGPVGCELALRLASRGHSVCLIERLDRVMPRLLDGDLAKVVQCALEDRGIDVFVNEEVRELGGSGKVDAIYTARHELPCEVVCLAVGMRPRTDLARAIGIATGPTGGIAVDESMRTNLEGVYACGDCVETVEVTSGEPRLSMLWHTAKWQGHVAGTNSVGGRRRYPGSLSYAIVDTLSGWAGSSGHVQESFDPGRVEVQDQRTSECWLRLFLVEDRLCGFQFVGRSVPRELGQLLGAIRLQLRLRDWKSAQELSLAAGAMCRPPGVMPRALIAATRF